MESTSNPGKLQITEHTKMLLEKENVVFDKFSVLITRRSGRIEVKGKVDISKSSVMPCVAVYCSVLQRSAFDKILVLITRCAGRFDVKSKVNISKC